MVVTVHMCVAMHKMANMQPSNMPYTIKKLRMYATYMYIVKYNKYKFNWTAEIINYIATLQASYSYNLRPFIMPGNIYICTICTLKDHVNESIKVQYSYLVYLHDLKDTTTAH